MKGTPMKQNQPIFKSTNPDNSLTNNQDKLNLQNMIRTAWICSPWLNTDVMQNRLGLEIAHKSNLII